MTVARYFRGRACNNAWANYRLLTACSGLTPEELAAARTGFFPSIIHTLNHILTVDWFYVGALEGHGVDHAGFAEIPRAARRLRIPDRCAFVLDLRFLGPVGPCLAAFRIHRLTKALEAAKGSDQLRQAFLANDGEEAVVDLISSKNGLPKFMARPIYKHFLARLQKGKPATGSP